MIMISLDMFLPGEWLQCSAQSEFFICQFIHGSYFYLLPFDLTQMSPINMTLQTKPTPPPHPPQDTEIDTDTDTDTGTQVS